MAAYELTFRIGGEAGQGVESGGAGFAKALTRGGYHVFGSVDYYERIRGGHNFFTIRASTEPIHVVTEKVDVLIAMDDESLVRHVSSLNPLSAIVMDENTKVPDGALDGYTGTVARLPLLQIATDNGAAVMVNTAALAAAATLVGFDLEHIAGVIADNFGKKGGTVVDANHQVAQQIAKITAERHGQVFQPGLPTRETTPHALIDGSRAFAMGAVMAGCKFTAGYPMTPATPVLEYMSVYADAYGMVVKHAEDEIGAINMIVGAAHAGVRAMTCTSGGGFDLMTEGVSLAAALETPVVIYLGQRPGPATGLSTRTAQGDLMMAIHSAHGEFARAILAPHTPEEHFAAAIRAFNLAEKYQAPVIVLTDHMNATNVASRPAELFSFDQVTVDRGKLLSREELDAQDEYLRFAYTHDGVSPRALPGNGPKSVYLVSSNLHRQDGHITEDREVAVAVSDKYMAKERGLRSEMRAPYHYGPAEADLTFVAWGSSYGASREAMERINDNGGSANLVLFVDLWPFPAEKARAALQSAKRLVCVETNVKAQFAQLLQAEAGIAVDQTILRYDGRGLTSDYIIDRLEA